jgi:hypothetical protein
MERYLLNLLPRLRNFGKKLNQTEAFVDKTWVLYDLQNNKITYRFKRNGLLRKTINGDIQDLIWELETNDAISIIDSLSRRGEMFKHGFVLDGLLIVQKDGFESIPLILYNESVVKDGNINKYLFEIFVLKENLKKVNSVKGYFLKHDNYNELISIGTEVYDNQLRLVENDVINLSDRIIIIKDGKISSITYFKTFTSVKGKMRVTSMNIALVNGGISLGDKVIYGDNNSFTGKLKMRQLGVVISIKNGQVIDVSYFGQDIKLAAVIILALLAILTLYLINKAADMTSAI